MTRVSLAGLMILCRYPAELSRPCPNRRAIDRRRLTGHPSNDHHVAQRPPDYPSSHERIHPWNKTTPSGGWSRH